MALNEKLSAAELALIDVLEDPIFCVEFMRSTRDGQTNKALWPNKEFKYRWYQRDLMTDKTPNIVLTGGRAIGKCQPESVLLLTDKGYVALRHLRKLPHFTLIARDEHGNLVRSRAVAQKDKFTKVFRIKLTNGYETLATVNHPFLTPDGYKLLGDMQSGDLVAAMTHLPYYSDQTVFRWHELRTMGYFFLNRTWKIEAAFKPRFQQIRTELRAIASRAEMNYLEGLNGEIFLKRYLGAGRNFISQLFLELGISELARYNAVGGSKTYTRRVTETLMRENIDNIRVFLEALLAQWADFTRTKVTLDCKTIPAVQDIAELLLRFGIESTIDDTVLTVSDERSVYRLYTVFQMPGIAVENLKLPPQSQDIHSNYRWVPVESITVHSEEMNTYAVYVYDHHSYISDNMIVHNSLVLEDQFIYRALNQHTEFPETKESLLATANQAQIEPVLGRLITRFTTSPLLKEFLGNRINRTLGVLDFRFGPVQYLLRARIAGSKGEQNMVGLHLPKATIDEGQLFTMGAYTQLMPAINTWEQDTQVFIAGVPNGLRTSALYYADKRLGKYKKYRIPAQNNPYYTQHDDLDNIKRYGGRDSDDYQQLVLGKHGAAAFTVLARDQIQQDNYDFYRYRYTHEHMAQGMHYSAVFERHDFSDYNNIVAGIDTGYVDPTIISVIGRMENGQWRLLARYELRRIDFPKQEEIINWLDTHYHFQVIGLDIGSGGGGTQIYHSFLYRDQYRTKNYAERVVPVQFGERVAVGFDTDDKELTQTTKTLGAALLVQQLQQHTLVLSSIDQECISEMERITKQKSMSGEDRYFIMHAKGTGASEDDHIFASLICYAIATRDLSFQKKKRKKLGRASGGSV